MVEDLSTHHDLIGDLFARPRTAEEWARYRLSDEQVQFYRENGYLAGIKLLNEEQINVLRAELAELVDPRHPGNDLFYEFNSNESADPEKILFHALEPGASPRAFMICCGTLPSLFRRCSYWRVRSASGTTSFSTSRRTTAES